LTAARPTLAYAAGLRASVVTTLPVAVAVLSARPVWYWAAIGAWLVSLADTGAAFATRTRATSSLALLGGVTCAVCGAMSVSIGRVGLAAVLFVVAFGFSMVRALGDTAAAVGSLLVVVAIIALGAHAGSLDAVLAGAGMFTLGGLASTAASLATWRVHPTSHAHAAVAASLDALADAAGELEALVRARADAAAWGAFVLAFHRRVRSALEAAQAAVVATRLSPAEAPVTQRLELLLEQEDRIFEALVALADELEAQRGLDASQGDAADSLARVAASLRALGLATLDRPGATLRDARGAVASPPEAAHPQAQGVGLTRVILASALATSKMACALRRFSRSGSVRTYHCRLETISRGRSPFS